MKLKVITPEKGTEIDKEIYHVEAQGVNGSFGVLEGHIPFISVLKDKSILKYQSKKTTHIQSIELENPVLEVTQINKNKATKETEIVVIASKITQQ
ncbi:MAG: hypothetical protein SFU25_10800 [Candidatus Caenarcaniphilales bacterium]|nr:hypothetical protein [Candidatus Caenarcaniphilales bacterium]